MDDLFFVGGMEAFRNLYGDIHGLLQRERSGVEPFVQTGAFDVRHGNKDHPVRLADFEDRADVGVVERGGRLGLSLEPFSFVFVGQRGVFEEFESDGAVEVEVAGFVHRAHAALAELLDDFVMGYGPPDQCRLDDSRYG